MFLNNYERYSAYIVISGLVLSIGVEIGEYMNGLTCSIY